MNYLTFAVTDSTLEGQGGKLVLVGVVQNVT
jgi:hypothetical protein